ncbi:MAG: TRAP transporter permease [Aminobacterium colombiense]|uniref:TRAP transporter permease n=1 Tax=Aminobacterium TaxID=81466 RepID=UPI002357E65F|nr:TRAP transporter permease [Aminobacterium sp. EBM-42]MDD2378288.1 TRAP transporter permease [Aminobacterium colombiense]MDD3768284.1 TRAP transporter permease [Aminobacterium colombiense]MDD4265783.1 TRAP transporter permease [Aminobacterium colombiense]MDD4585126.1 TRAP transporter permease [Aminobacterium colombiense]
MPNEKTEAAQNSEINLDELRRQFDTEARYRDLLGWQGILITAIAVAMSLFHFYTSGFGLLLAMKQGSLHLAFVLVLVFLLYPARETSRRDGIPLYDFILAALAAFATLYIFFEFEDLVNRAGLPTTMDIIVGFMGIILLLEATRRVSSPVLPCIAIFFLFYCYFGRHFPQMFQHRGFNIQRIINHMYLGTEGVFGIPLGVSATFVFMFILFGSVLEQTGMGRFIIDLAMAMAGGATGGPAKVAVLSSGFMGSISGSSVANVCTTGMFTIPLMKSVGYKPHFAGAVEAVASTGGQIMPPVMGAAAFIMAQFMGVPYVQVALAAVVPALLYYFAVMVQVHFEATRLGLLGLPKEKLPSLLKLLKAKGHLLLPLFGIVYFLLAGFTPLKAAYNGIIISIAVSFLNKETRLTPKKLKLALENGAKGALGVACACGTVGIIVGTATLTGLGLRIASAIVAIAGGKLLATLLLTMVACILLGAGLPTTANFIVTSTMAAPALFKLGVPPMAAYMFVLYFGIAADLSPPVALAAYAGAGIAGAEPMRTGITAVKLALAGFIVPFIYVYNPMLVLVDFKPFPFILAVVTAVLGVFLLGMATIGFYKTSMAWWKRIISLGGALGLLIPGWQTDVIGLIILIGIHILQVRKAKKEAGTTE